MKKLLLILSVSLMAISAKAQSVTIRIVANDGATATTNVVSLSSERVTGLLALYQKDKEAKGANAITFGQFILQELGDKANEWTLQAGKDAIKAAGVTGGIPDGLARKWFTLTAQQQAAAVAYLNSVND